MTAEERADLRRRLDATRNPQAAREQLHETGVAWTAAQSGTLAERQAAMRRHDQALHEYDLMILACE